MNKNATEGGAQGVFDGMSFFVGDSNYYDYNHIQKMRLPNTNDLNDSNSPIIKNDGTMSLYVRCRDANGNFNVDEFEFRFCADKGPDTTPPLIEGTSIENNGYVQYGIGKVPMELYVNEPSECKWSRVDQDYVGMENEFSCSTQASEFNAQLTYTCKGELTGIKDREDNIYYIKCKDQPGKNENDRNAMTQSYLNRFVLRGTQPLNILSVGPNGILYGNTDIINVSLHVETDDGAQEGTASCYFSPNGAQNSFVPMFATNDYRHSQRLDLPAGFYTYFFRCIDLGGNVAESNTSFLVYVDRISPGITRAYKEGEDSLKIVTDEDARCVYSLTGCNYNFNEATLKFEYASPDNARAHYAKWGASNTYYIKCRDAFGNEPSPNACNLVASAVRLQGS